MSKKGTGFIGLLVVLGLVATACGAAATAAPTLTATTPEPAPAEEAERTIRVETTGSLTFNPSKIKVEPGETIKFDLLNTSDISHTFTIAISSAKREILTDVRLQGGESKSVTLTFPEEPAQLYLFCRPHQALGMVGAVTVGTRPAKPESPGGEYEGY